MCVFVCSDPVVFEDCITCDCIVVLLWCSALVAISCVVVLWSHQSAVGCNVCAVCSIDAVEIILPRLCCPVVVTLWCCGDN